MVVSFFAWGDRHITPPTDTNGDGECHSHFETRASKLSPKTSHHMRTNVLSGPHILYRIGKLVNKRPDANFEVEKNEVLKETQTQVPP